MIPEGVTQPVQGGFEIFIRDERSVTVKIDCSDEQLPTLTYRQRFTFAHELAHTFYYDLSAVTPRLLPRLPRRDRLERYCDVAAGILLLPEHFLTKDLERRPVTLQSLRWLSRRYLASSAAVLRRISAAHSATSDDNAVLYVRAGDDVIEIAFMPPRFLPIFPHPKAFLTTTPVWCRGVVARDFWDAPESEACVTVRDTRVSIKKTPHHRQERYYVEVSIENDAVP